MNAAISRPVPAVLRALGSLLPGRGRRRRRSAPVTLPWREDSASTYPSVGLTPSRALAFLQAADAGRPQSQFELFAEMLQKWPRLAAVEATRRMALTGLEWEVVAAPGATAEVGGRGTGGPGTGQGRVEALRAAEYCREVLEGLENWPAVLMHLAGAIGYGVTVVELVWENGRLVDVVPVPQSRLVADVHEPWRLRVLTADEPTHGIVLDEQPHKWIVHQPRARAGRPFAGGLLRASVLLYVAQNLSFKDWLIFSQTAGMPVRVARFDPGTPDADRQQLLRMLESLGTEAVAVFGKNIELTFVEPARGGERPYEPLQRYCNTEITILWLGQHLTTDMLTSGSRAAAEVHDRVREDLLAQDIADEGATVRRAVLRPLVQAQFGDGVPVPRFRRSLVQAADAQTLASTLAVAVNELGISVPRRWVHQALGIPEAQAGEPLLEGRKP